MMKKLVAFSLSAVVALVTASCGKEVKKPEELERNFSCDAVIVQDETEYTAKLERIDNTGWNAVFTAPETIKGLEISLFSDKCTVNFKELSYTADREELPQYGLLAMVTSAVDDCIAGKELKTTQEGKVLKQSGSVSGFDYTASLDGKTISRIEIQPDITAEFSTFKAE